MNIKLWETRACGQLFSCPQPFWICSLPLKRASRGPGLPGGDWNDERRGGEIALAGTSSWMDVRSRAPADPGLCRSGRCGGRRTSGDASPPVERVSVHHASRELFALCVALPHRGGRIEAGHHPDPRGGLGLRRRRRLAHGDPEQLGRGVGPVRRHVRCAAGCGAMGPPLPFLRPPDGHRVAPPPDRVTRGRLRLGHGARSRGQGPRAADRRRRVRRPSGGCRGHHWAVRADRRSLARGRCVRRRGGLCDASVPGPVGSR